MIECEHLSLPLSPFLSLSLSLSFSPPSLSPSLSLSSSYSLSSPSLSLSPPSLSTHLSILLSVYLPFVIYDLSIYLSIYPSTGFCASAFTNMYHHFTKILLLPAKSPSRSSLLHSTPCMILFHYFALVISNGKHRSTAQS